MSYKVYAVIGTCNSINLVDVGQTWRFEKGGVGSEDAYMWGQVAAKAKNRRVTIAVLGAVILS
jgi:hypothetical protein